MTNREWIESLDDTDFLKACVRMVAFDCVCCVYAEEACYAKPHDCVEGQVKWLNAEHKENNDEI